MTSSFDKEYWESHWRQADERGPGRAIEANPYLARELAGITPGTALDAGCGEGAEAIWLATAGWQVTAADISGEALSRASERAAAAAAPPERLRWVEADLGVWEPVTPFDLVTTHYAHPALGQLAFYQRIAGWVAPRGTLLIVGHLHPSDAHGHTHGPPEEASVTVASISAGLDRTEWDIVTAEETVRGVGDRAGRAVELHDVIVRATRRP